MEQVAGWRTAQEGEPEWEAMELEAASAIVPANSSSSRSPAPILSDPLHYWSVPSDAVLPLSQMEDIFHPAHEDDIQELLQGPRDQRDLDKWLPGERSFTTEDAMAVQTPPDPILNLIDFIPKDGCRSGLRGARERLTFSLEFLCFEINRDVRHHQRRNNDHWTLEEVTRLVKGISKYGVGRWTELKRDYFSTSIRSSVNIKDKWRNLLIACGVKFTSKKKRKAQKTMCLPLDMSLIEQIKQLADIHPYPKQSTPNK